MESFVICPQCQDLDTRRTECIKCGYSKKPLPKEKADQSKNIRGRLFVLLIGLGCLSLGWREWKVSQGTSETPTDIKVEDLEAGQRPSQNHIRLGKQVRLYPMSVYIVPGREKDGNNPTIKECFFPVVSVKKLLVPVAGADKVAIPKDFVVLASTHQFKRLNEIPQDIAVQDELRGMVVNSIQSLQADAAKLIKESFPNVDPNQLLIVEVDRKPSSPAFWMTLFGVGVLFLLAALRAFWNDFRSKASDKE